MRGGQLQRDLLEASHWISIRTRVVECLDCGTSRATAACVMADGTTAMLHSRTNTGGLRSVCDLLDVDWIKGEGEAPPL